MGKFAGVPSGLSTHFFYVNLKITFLFIIQHHLRVIYYYGL